MQKENLFRNIEGHPIKSIEDDQEHIELVFKYIPAYSELSREAVQITNLSGGGGSVTWKVFCNDSEAEPLVIHSRLVDTEKDPTVEGKMEAFQKILYENGLCPPRYVSGESWWIEPFYENVPQKFSITQKATLLAKIHNCPTDWYTPFREQLRKYHPALQEASDHSFIFGLMKSNWMRFIHLDDPYVQKQLIKFEKIIPKTTAGKRVVSCHGDFHDANLLCNTSNQILAVDFEFSNVSFAAYDLAFISIKNSYDDLLDFCKIYLMELGHPSSKKDV